MYSCFNCCHQKEAQQYQIVSQPNCHANLSRQLLCMPLCISQMQICSSSKMVASNGSHQLLVSTPNISICIVAISLLGGQSFPSCIIRLRGTDFEMDAEYGANLSDWALLVISRDNAVIIDECRE